MTYHRGHDAQRTRTDRRRRTRPGRAGRAHAAAHGPGAQIRGHRCATRSAWRWPSPSTWCSATCACPTATAWTSWNGCRRKRPGLPCAVITAHGNVETAVRALKLGAFDFVSKPLDLAALRRLISSALKLAERAEGDGLTFRGPRLLGQSAPMRAAARDDRARGAQPGAGAHLPARAAPARNWWRD